MKFINSKLFLILFASMAFNANAARTDCPEALIENIQIEGKKVLYKQVGYNYRTLGYLGNNDGTEERLSIMLASQLANKSVVVGYGIDNYNCSLPDYGTAAYIIRSYN